MGNKGQVTVFLCLVLLSLLILGLTSVEMVRVSMGGARAAEAADGAAPGNQGGVQQKTV